MSYRPGKESSLISIVAQCWASGRTEDDVAHYVKEMQLESSRMLAVNLFKPPEALSDDELKDVQAIRRWTDSLKATTGAGDAGHTEQEDV